MTYSLCINKCSQHGVYSISVEDGGGCGDRVTPSKCCGSWTTLHKWNLSVDHWKEIALLASNIVKEMRKGTTKRP